MAEKKPRSKVAMSSELDPAYTGTVEEAAKDGSNCQHSTDPQPRLIGCSGAGDVGGASLSAALTSPASRGRFASEATAVFPRAAAVGPANGAGRRMKMGGPRATASLGTGQLSGEVCAHGACVR